MIPLPKQRALMSRPFTIKYVDFAGSIQIQSGICRDTTIKAWIAVFGCFDVRAKGKRYMAEEGIKYHFIHHRRT